MLSPPLSLIPYAFEESECKQTPIVNNVDNVLHVDTTIMNDKTSSDISNCDDPSILYNKMSLKELQAALTKLGRSSKGKKRELAERLAATTRKE